MFTTWRRVALTAVGALVAATFSAVPSGAAGLPVLTLTAPSSIAGPYLASTAQVSVTGAEAFIDVRLQTGPSPAGPWAESTLDKANIYEMGGNFFFGATAPGTVYLRAVNVPTDGTTPVASNVAAVSVGGRAVPGWLKQLNSYRQQWGALPAMENADLNSWVAAHAQYMAKNKTFTGLELKGKPGYSKNGATAGSRSALIQRTTAGTAVKEMMNQPFHALAMMDAAATLASFGYAQGYAGVWPQMQVLPAYGVGSPDEPRTFPADGGKAVAKAFVEERPDPLTSCAPEYRKGRAGTPFFISWGQDNPAPGTVKATLKKGNTSIPLCVITESNYRNPNKADQKLGRMTLAERGHAVVLVPASPLTSGTYTATVKGKPGTHTWSFKV